MKSLDEVIYAYELCDSDEGGCEGCAYCADCDESPFIGALRKRADAIHYLKAYRENQHAYEEGNRKAEEARERYLEVLTDYVALKQYWTEQQENHALTWDELKSMEGKPVWLVVDGKERWRIIREVSSEHLILESGLPLHRCWMNHPDGWQAYRKERE